jgi:hypothetical protein
MKQIIFLFFYISLISACSSPSDNSTKLEGKWTGKLIYRIEKEVHIDSAKTLEEQLGRFEERDMIAKKSLVFKFSESTVWIDMREGEAKEFTILKTNGKDSELLLISNDGSVLGLIIDKLTKDSLILTDPMPTLSLGGGDERIAKRSYVLTKKK